MENTPILDLPMIAPSQAQKHVTHNEALMTLDVLVHLSVLARDLVSPPGGAVEGSRYIVSSPASGDWSGHENQITVFRDGVWLFFAPSAGWSAYVEADALQVIWDGSQWSVLAGSSETSFDRLSVNTALDPLAHLSVQSDKLVFSHDETSGSGSGSLQTVLNKKTVTDTASVLYQTGWSGRAELGLNGDDDFSIKVSAAGLTWTTAFETAAATADIRIAKRLVIGEGAHAGNGLTIAMNNPAFSIQDTGGTGNAHSAVIGWVDGNGDQKAWCGLGSSSNTQFTFLTHYADGLRFMTYGGSYPIEFAQQSTVRMKVHTNGNIGIHETDPTTPLHVDGAIRVGTAPVSALPSASGSGAGAFIFVSDENGGATLAFSDGSQWRRVQDRAIVS
jgi:hypothetical protein